MNINVILGIPNIPPVYSFNQMNEFFTYEVNNPQSISSVYFSLTNPLNSNTVCTLYYSAYPYENYEYLGAIFNDRPSAIIPTGFPLNSALKNINKLLFIIKFEDYNTVKDLVNIIDKNSLLFSYTKAVAENLYNYFCSSQAGSFRDNNGREVIAVYPETFDKWMEKFTAKIKVDPFFLEKKNLQN